MCVQELKCTYHKLARGLPVPDLKTSEQPRAQKKSESQEHSNNIIHNLDLRTVEGHRRRFNEHASARLRVLGTRAQGSKVKSNMWGTCNALLASEVKFIATRPEFEILT